MTKPSIFNFILFIILIGFLCIFHYQQDNDRIVPIEPVYYQNKIFAGEVHYSRIPVEYWEHRIKMIKAMGLNTLSVYVMWNYHEVSKEIFDYQTGNKNLTLFIELCIKHQMKILFRPGPYVCAEWDFGGFPARLLSISNLTLRSSNPQYLQEVQIYFSSLAPIVRPYIRNPFIPDTFNNPIIMLQIENEYGFYGTDKKYILELRRMWRQLDIHCEEYFVDWIENIKSSSWDGAHVGINNGYPNNVFHMVKTMNKNGIAFGGQIYSGWYKKWGESAEPASSLDNFVYMYEELLRNHHSFSVYLVHGGTNFGLAAGANYVYNSDTDFAGVITSYDYQSPITENGNVTDKYMKFRQLIKGYLDDELPVVPEPIPSMNTENFNFVSSHSLISVIKNSQKQTFSNKLEKFESSTLKMFNQGAVLYSYDLEPYSLYQVEIQVHDFGLVFVNNQLIMAVNRSALTKQNVSINCGKTETCLVEIFVESMGHINFGTKMQYDFKGLIRFDVIQVFSVTKNRYVGLDLNHDWRMHKIDLEAELQISSTEQGQKCLKPPCIFELEITLNKTDDTFIDLSKYQKGYVWVNGHNLGRFWNVGPQQRLYCPGVWLKKDKNKITLLDLMESQFKEIMGKQFSF